MSEFWQYFRDVLRWPLIHKPGPLAALVRGKAACLDDARDDIVNFRKQWFPEFCENGLVQGFGKSRGLVRHPKENAEQFRSRVVNAYAWHLLGGKVEGLPNILKFYGLDIGEIVNMRKYTPTRWAEFQLGLKTPTTQAEQAALLADLDAIIWLVNEYKPARSVLFRIYTDTYNLEPLIWSRDCWSEGYWSHFSGVEYPDSENPQGPGQIIVSFGMVHRAQTEIYIDGEFLANIWLSQTHAFRIPYLDKFIWSESAWSDLIVRNHGFVIGQLFSTQAADLIYKSSEWVDGQWPQHPWANGFYWDRALPEWQMPWTTISKSQLFYNDTSDKIYCADRDVGGRASGSEAFVAPNASDSAVPRRDAWAARYGGVWGDINSNWTLPLVPIAGPAPRWGEFVWSNEEPAIKYLRIDEQFHERLPIGLEALNPAFGKQSPVGASVANVMTLLLPWGDFPVWGRFEWSQEFPEPVSYSISSLFATLAGEALCEGGVWPEGAWPEKPWGTVLDYGREIEALEIRPRHICKSQLVFGDSVKDSAFGDINASYGVPQISIAGEAPRWGEFAWSNKEPKISFVAIEERFEENLHVQSENYELTENFGQARMEQTHALLLCNADRPIWSEFEWSAAFEHGAALGMAQKAAFLGGEAEWKSKPWPDEAWPDEAWGEITGHARPQEPFGIVLKGES